MEQMLEQAGKTELAQIVSNALSHEMRIQEDTVLELSELHEKFNSLSFKCEKAIEELVESGKLSLSDLVRRTKKEIIYDELSHIENLTSCLDIISSHNHFLNCHLLVVLAKEFLNHSKLLDELQTHDKDIEQFLSNTKIQTLHKTLTPFVTKSPQEDPVTLSVVNSYGEYKMSLVEHLLRILFGLEHKDIPKLFRVIPGSLTIVLLVPQHISLSLIEHSKHKIQFMRLSGIISLQIGETYILQDEENDNYTFEQALIEATEAGNYEAVQFLLQQVCVDVNTQTEPDKESIVKIKEEADKINKDKNNNLTFQKDAGTTALMVACCHGNTGILQLLIASKANLNLQTSTGWTALMYATLLGYGRVIDLLLEHNADIDKKKISNQATALTYALSIDNIVAVKKLLKKSNDLGKKQALIEATKAGNYEAVQFLLQQVCVDVNSQTLADKESLTKIKEKADMPIRDENRNYYLQDDAGTTALMVASYHGDIDILQLLIESKADLNLQTSTGWTALMYATLLGNGRVIDLLLEHNADIDKKKFSNQATALTYACSTGDTMAVKKLMKKYNDLGKKELGPTPLYVTSQNGQLPIVEQLLKTKVDPNIPMDNGETPLYIASKNGYLRIVKQLLKARAHPDLSDSSGQAPLHHACFNGFLPIVQELLQENANPNIATDDGVTPLHFACQISHLPVVEELLQKQADPNFKRKDGATPLHVACHHNFLSIVDKLLQEKADPNAQMTSGVTPLYIASEDDYLSIVDKLLQEKANPNISRKDGLSPLYAACFHNHKSVVKQLLKGNANPNTITEDGTAPLHVASHQGYLYIVRLLLQKEADPNIQRKNGETPLLAAVHGNQSDVVRLLLKYHADPTMKSETGETALRLAVAQGNSEIASILHGQEH